MNHKYLQQLSPEEINDPFVTRANTKTTQTTTTTTINKPTPQEAELPSLDECYDKTEQINITISFPIQ